MLRLVGPQVECLFDLGLPVEVPELPADLAAIDAFLADPALLAPVVAARDARAREFGRPSIPIERYVRFMVIKTRTGWGYETLVREVSDSLHLRRFCRIAVTERAPDESTSRKLTRRLGPEVVDEITPTGDRSRSPREALHRTCVARGLDGRGGRHALPQRRGRWRPTRRACSRVRPRS
jgi:transposase, IS5 family